MRIIFAAAMIVLLSGPALAQFSSTGDHMQQAGEADKDKTHSEMQNERDAKRAYERSLRNIPDKTAADPWGTMRNDAAPKAVVKAGHVKPRN
jgi:hypothetical protein